MEYLSSLEPLLKSYWYIAIPASLIFMIQTFMTFIGTDVHDGLDADFHGDLAGVDTSFELFSFRNLTNFLLGVGWTGISCYYYIPNKLVLVILSVIVGSLFVYGFFLIIKMLNRLAEDNTFKYQDTIGKTAQVYLTIPASMKGKGKVSISVNGSSHELDAMTESEEIISNSEMVKVVRIESENILIVNKL